MIRRCHIAQVSLCCPQQLRRSTKVLKTNLTTTTKTSAPSAAAAAATTTRTHALPDQRRTRARCAVEVQWHCKVRIVGSGANEHFLLGQQLDQWLCALFHFDEMLHHITVHVDELVLCSQAHYQAALQPLQRHGYLYNGDRVYTHVKTTVPTEIQTHEQTPPTFTNSAAFQRHILLPTSLP